MRSITICCALLGLVLLCGSARAECDGTRNADDSDFTSFFKSLGCKVKQGAEDVAEAAKPYAEKIGEGAKDFGSSVAQKYDEIKHRLSDDASTPKSPSTLQFDAPTERVPLAPIAPTVPANVLNGDPLGKCRVCLSRSYSLSRSDLTALCFACSQIPLSSATIGLQSQPNRSYFFFFVFVFVLFVAQ